MSGRYKVRTTLVLGARYGRSVRGNGFPLRPQGAEQRGHAIRCEISLRVVSQADLIDRRQEPDRSLSPAAGLNGPDPNPEASRDQLL